MVTSYWSVSKLLQVLASFPETWKRLEEIHAARRERVASLSDADLELSVRNGMNVDEYLTSTIRHDIWHAAQIAVARRLWRTRAAPPA